MTPEQLKALESYVTATVRVMTEKGEHSSNVRLYVDARSRLERAFGRSVPVDLFDSRPTLTLPDIL